MPQFDFYTFINQVILIIFSFFILYFILQYFLLPKIATVLKSRQKLINSSKIALNLKSLNIYDEFIKQLLKK